jgi:hypothetical protein
LESESLLVLESENRCKITVIRITKKFTYSPMPICKETITIAIPNPKNPQETAVRDKTIKFENRHRGIIQPNTLNKMSTV